METNISSERRIKKEFFIIGVFFLILCIINPIVSVTSGDYQGVLWFCYFTLIVFTIGLFTKNLFLLSTALTSSFIVSFLWTQDYVSFLLFKHYTTGIAVYLQNASSIRLMSTAYHLLMLFFPPWAIFRLGKIHKLSWLGSAGLLFVVSIATLLSPLPPINCVEGTCNLGIFSPLEIFYKLPIPSFMINVIFMTLIIFIPTHLLFKKLIKWITKEEQNKKEILH